MNELQYATPAVAAQWANSRETHIAVATAIHGISGPGRSPEDIWENPTQAEWDHVCMAVENYVNAGVFAAEDDGRYAWGCEAVVLQALNTSATESAGVLETMFDDAAAERDAALESAFADAIGHDKYQRLLDESWQPFAGKAHLSMSLEDAVAREVKAANEFLETLADDKQEHIISAVLGEDAEVIEQSFDPVRPESPVFYRYPDVSEDWQSCPFQSADVRHLSDEAACAMVNNWVG